MVRGSSFAGAVLRLPLLVEGSNVRPSDLAGGGSASLMCSDQNAFGAAILEAFLSGAFLLKELHLEPLSKPVSQPPLETVGEEIALANLPFSLETADEET